MMSENGYSKFIAMLGDHLRLVAAASVSFSILAAVVWWAFGPRIEESMQDLVGTNELKDIIIEQGTRLEQNTIAIDGLIDRITAMEPAPSVAEYDVLRSAIDDVCVVGGVCRYTYRVRRTDAGLSCGAPTAQRVLVDASGTTHFPQQPRSERSAQRLTDEWAIVSSSFVVPTRISIGVAEFSLQMTYPDCDRDQLGRVVVIEESPHLIFEIGRAQ